MAVGSARNMGRHACLPRGLAEYNLAMPTYEYYCPANHKTVEVMHGMSRTVATWGELCELAETSTGKTPVDTPVEKLLSAGMTLASQKGEGDCGRPGGCCGGGACSH